MVNFTRDYYIGHPDDDSDKFEETMNKILHEDDVDKLHDYLKVFGDNYYYPALLDICLDRLATNCALHIIQGNLPHGPPNLAADHCEPRPKLPVLYHVIHVMCEPKVFHLLLTHCRALNQVNQPLQGLLPLHWLLDLLVKQGPLSKSCHRRSVSKLIDSLFLPEIRTKLECARMLAQHTHSLDKVAVGFIQNGEIIHLAALLLVAPFTSSEFESIKQHMSIKSIASQAIHGPDATEATCSAAALLYIFHKDGHKLTSHFNNPQKEAAEGDESIVNRLNIQQPQKRLVRVSKGDESFANHIIQQIGNLINFVMRLFSKSSKMTDKTSRVNKMMGPDDADELFGPDANLSFDHCRLLHSLLKEREGNDTFQLLQETLSHVDKEALYSRGGLPPTLMSAIRTFCNNHDDATAHIKSQVSLTYMQLLHFILGSLEKYDCLKWYPSMSLVNLILLLFLRPELKPILECAQLVAKRTNSVNEVALNLIQQRNLKQLAALLLVAHKKAMQPFDSGDTMKDVVSMENVVSQAFRGESCSVTATTGAAGLFEIFDKAGDTLTKHWLIHNHKNEHVEVIVKVATTLQRSGIQVLSTDVDLTNIHDASNREVLKTICERLGIKIHISKFSQINEESVFPSIKTVKERCRPRPFERRPRIDMTLGTREFSTSSHIVDRVSRGTLKHSWASPSPIVRNLAYLAMKFKRGVRFV